ncbi:hypothetical protein [Thermoleptolyngbya sp. M55_K2018_002]|uniref:hypothetical protein n=1 Tax=Thermoleptolyngbya sp. M55_K2018_002 TaxID=2747808 RepID=UPI0019E95084|nr:hypothetical protein [Thermoleptolyngbya sp. M55_K2018_002]HIK39430.1 hypothetical protein [Thermoleptolyngbya sp. M55_K2018_002]
MLSLALSILYGTQIDLFHDGRAQFVGLFLLEGWQHFGAALLAGCDLGRRKGDGTGFGVQGIDLSSCFDRSDCLLVRPGAKPNSNFDAAVCAIGMRSPLPTALHTGFQFGSFSFNAALAILGRIATQLNLSGRCRVILSPT